MIQAPIASAILSLLSGYTYIHHLLSFFVFQLFLNFSSRLYYHDSISLIYGSASLILSEPFHVLHSPLESVLVEMYERTDSESSIVSDACATCFLDVLLDF